MKTSFDLMKSLNENALPKIKKTRVLSEKENKLNEGAGAGYHIAGTIGAVDIKSFNVTKTEEDKYGVPTYFLDCDISATLEDVTFESYYDGGHVDSAQIQITYLALIDNHDPEEKGELNETNIAQSLEGTHVKNLVGGGWTHSTFTGDLEGNENADGSVYSDFCVYEIGYRFVDEDLVKFIDLAVQGENIEEEYIVYAEDYDELGRFDSEEEAIEYAKNTPNAVKVEQYSYRYEFDGDIDINSEYSETVWEKDDFEESEHIKESEKLEEKLNGNEIMVFSKRAIEAESEEELKKIANEIRYYSEPTYTRCMEIINGDGSVQYKAGQISDIIFQLNESVEHDLSKDILGDESNKRMSEDQRAYEKYLQFARDIKDGKNQTITLDSAKELLKNAYIKAKGYYSFEPEEIDKRIAKDIPDLFGDLEESSMEEVREKSAEKGLLEPEAVDESVEVIDEQVVSDKLTEVKSQGNVYMLQDNDTYIVGEDYNKEENLIENAEIYNNKEEADKDYFSRCDITRDGKEVDPTEVNPEKLKESISKSDKIENWEEYKCPKQGRFTPTIKYNEKTNEYKGYASRIKSYLSKHYKLSKEDEEKLKKFDLDDKEILVKYKDNQLGDITVID